MTTFADAIRDAIRPYCEWETCGRITVAIRYDLDKGILMPVCPRHSNNRIVPLDAVLRAASRTEMRERRTQLGARTTYGISPCESREDADAIAKAMGYYDGVLERDVMRIDGVEWHTNWREVEG